MKQSPTLLDAERVRVYPCLFLAAYAAVAAYLLLVSKNMVDPWGKPLGYDFMTFYAAAKMSLAGHAAAAFDIVKMLAVEKTVLPHIDMPFQWAYPPTFQLLSAPLALLPYGVSYLAFMGSTITAWAFTLWRLPAVRPYTTLMLAAPATAVCVFHGQNTMITAALFAGGMGLLSKRPFWAGIILGGLAFKPQMGLLLSIAFAVSGQWRAFIGAALSAALFSALATAVFGIGLWSAFIDHFAFVQMILRNGFLPWSKMPSAFVFCRLLGIAEVPAFAFQMLTASAVALTVAIVWRRAGPSPLAGATLMTGTLLLMPYVFDYEFVVLLLPLALLAVDIGEHGAALPEKLVLAFAYGIAPLMRPLADWTHVQFGFIVLLLTFALCARRALARAATTPSRALAAPG